jgi:catechol 2,3-dioxygenase-like lactoylglutathione lyase family enzyme
MFTLKVMMIQQIDHINIVVSDLKKSLDFYESLGFRITGEATLKGEWIESLVGLDNVYAQVVYMTTLLKGPRIELLQYYFPEGKKSELHSHPHTIGLRHIALKVNNITSTVKTLEQKGIHFFSAPIKVPSRVIEHDEGHKTLCYCLDPDGVIIELAEYVG